MVTICFPDLESKRRALGFLADRFTFASWVTGQVDVPDEAIPALTSEAIPFQVQNGEPEPTYEEVVAAHDRGETLDVVDAFAQIAGIDRDTMLQQIADHKSKGRLNGA